MTFNFLPENGGTKLATIHTVSGYLPAGLNTWAKAVDGVLTEQVNRLKNYIERGNPAPATK